MMLRPSPSIDEASRILEDPVERAPLILASTLERSYQGPCSLEDLPEENAWLARLEGGWGRVELLIVSGVIVAALSTQGRGRRALETLPPKAECRVEVFKVDLESLPYKEMLLEATRRVEPPHAWIGSVLYGYKVEAIVGEGAFSYVLRAQAPWGVIALKVLKPSHAEDPGKVWKFTMEALTQAAVSNVPTRVLEEAAAMAQGVGVDVLESGRDAVARVYGIHVPPGSSYLEQPPVTAMELMEGSLEDGQASIHDVAASAARALALAHALGYGHFDLKPGNILRRGGMYKLSDFSGYIRGPKGFIVENVTPSYADPYLVASKGVGVGLDSDVYNYYTLLVRLATGHSPACTLPVNSFLLAMHTGEKPRLPSPPAYATRLLDALARAYTGADSPASLLEEVSREYSDCIRVEAGAIGKALGGEWVDYALAGLSIDRGERPGSMVSQRSVPWESLL